MNRHTLPLRRLTASVLAAIALSPLGAMAAWNTNLLVNPGADAVAGGNGDFVSNLPGWTVGGELTAIDYALGCPGGYPCLTDPVPPEPGPNHFGGGYGTPSTGTQRVSLGFASGAIGGNGAFYSLAGWLGGYASQDDYATLSVRFVDASESVLGTATVGPVTAADRNGATAMLFRQANGWVPAGAVAADVTLSMIRTGGSSNDGYADSLSFELREANATLSSPASAVVGSTFTTTVATSAPFAGVYAGDELLAFGFDVQYDDTLLRLVSATVAPGFDDDSALFDDVDVAGSAFPGQADTGQSSITLAALTFEVLATGDALIQIGSDAAGNLSEGLVYAQGQSRDVFGRTTVSLAPVPEPGTWALMGAGLLFVGLRRARRR